MAEGQSPVERIKEASRFLRGTLHEELSEATDHFSKDATQILKHHGVYQQDDRDERLARRARGESGKRYIMMVRTAVPGGVLTADQLLRELELADQLAGGTLRLTTRQSIQHHGVPKGNLRELIARIHDAKLTTLAACGDVVRNVMCCPAPYENDIYREVQTLCRAIASHFRPRTGAYYEIWLRDRETGERQRVAACGDADPPEDEPLYGPSYLPRKFKIGIGFCHDNCVDVYTHDVGLLAILREDAIFGYNVLVGGGMGVTPSNAATFPALGKRLAFVTPDQVVPVIEAIVKIQRDHGDRSNRKTARLKYLVHRWGIRKLRAEIESRLGTRLCVPVDDDVFDFDDHLGWHEDGAGRWFYGLNVENGRLADTPRERIKSAVAAICRDVRPSVRITSHQSLIFGGLDEAAKKTVTQILAAHDVRPTESISTVRRWSMACVAWPTCGLAITESERALPAIMDQLEPVLERFGLAREAFTVRMTGCPNGCARPYNADIALVGKAKDRYTILVGGQRLGKRLNFIFADLVPRDRIVATLEPVFAFFAKQREPGETLGDFCHRVGYDRLVAFADAYQPDGD